MGLCAYGLTIFEELKGGDKVALACTLHMSTLPEEAFDVQFVRILPAYIGLIWSRCDVD